MGYIVGFTVLIGLYMWFFRKKHVPSNYTVDLIGKALKRLMHQSKLSILDGTGHNEFRHFHQDEVKHLGTQVEDDFFLAYVIQKNEETFTHTLCLRSLGGHIPAYYHLCFVAATKQMAKVFFENGMKLHELRMHESIVDIDETRNYSVELSLEQHQRVVESI